MSAIDLVLLGFLADRPMSAYELARFIEHCNLGDMVKISTPAVYKNLLKLRASGYLAAATVKEGVAPEKAVYSLTGDGRRHFDHLMARHAQESIKFHFDFNAFILHLAKVDRAEGIRLLDAAREQLQQRQRALAAQAEMYGQAPPLVGALIRQFTMLNETLLTWLEGFRAEYLGLNV